MALPKQYNIKWKRSDYITLGKAVANFNRKINELNREEQKLYLPEVMNYQEVKENITTRSELNRVLNSLRRFNKEGAEDLYTTKAGEQITKWERQELTIQTRTASRRLKTELSELKLPGKTGFSRVQMGSLRAREIEQQLKSLSKLESKTGYEFERLSRRIKMLGTSDFTLKKAYVFQENFMDNLQNLAKNTPEFKKVYDYFSSIKNPITFFNTTQKSEALQDFFVWYQMPENYASFSTQEDLANYILKEYEII